MSSTPAVSIKKPTILPDIFSLCSILTEATSYIDFGYDDNDNNKHNGIQHNDSESHPDGDIDDDLTEYEEEEEEEEAGEETETENEVEDEDDDDDDDEDEEDYDDDEYLDESFESNESDNVTNVISHLIHQANHQQTNLNELIQRLLLLRSQLSDTENTSNNDYELQLQSKQDLLFLIATFTYAPNQTLNQNYFNVLKFYVMEYYQFQHLYIDDILHVIVSYIASSFRFCSQNDEFKNYNNKIKQVSFENNQSIVRFDKARSDYLNIVSQTYVLNSKDLETENEFNILINCFVMDKGDEFWLGLIDKNDYSINKSVEQRYGSVLYYGGRESLIGTERMFSKWDNGYGAIHKFGEVKIEKLPFYCKGDWISFLITKHKYKSCYLSIYKNGELVYNTDELPFTSQQDDEEKQLYFMCTLDDEIDAIYMEQAMYHGIIPTFK